MHNDSKLIAEAYLKKLNEGMRVVPAPTSPSQQPPSEEGEEESNLKSKLKDVIHQSSLSDEEKKACLSMIGFEEDEENNNYERDRTDQDRNDKSAIDYAREDKAAAERDKWTQGQGVGGKYHF